MRQYKRLWLWGQEICANLNIYALRWLQKKEAPAATGAKPWENLGGLHPTRFARSEAQGFTFAILARWPRATPGKPASGPISRARCSEMPCFIGTSPSGILGFGVSPRAAHLNPRVIADVLYRTRTGVLIEEGVVAVDTLWSCHLFRR